MIVDLDEKLNLVLAKQEYEYLKGYNLYIKRKEKELRDLIEKLNEKNSNNTLKDEKINQLEKAVDSLRNDLMNSEKKNDETSKQIKDVTTRIDVVTQERDFLKKQVMETKRQNKILTASIKRLQYQIDNPIEPLKADEGANVQTFMTEGKPVQMPSAPPEKDSEAMKQTADVYGLSTI